MSARILAVVCAGEEDAALSALPALVALARAEPACLRLAFFRAIPPPRVDRADRIVRHTDAEMARIASAITDTFTAALRRFDDVVSDVVVRFGTPRHEVAIETDVFAPTLVAVCAPSDAGPLNRLRASRIRHHIARRAAVRVLVLHAPVLPRTRGTVVTREAWRTSP